MGLEELISKIEELESKSILSSKKYIEHYGWSKLKENLDLYAKGQSFGIPQQELESLFETPSEKIVEVFVQEQEEVVEVPPQEVVENLDQVSDLEEKEVEQRFFFLNDEKVHNALLNLSQDGILPILSNQICDLAGVESTKGNLGKISRCFEEVGFKSKYVSNPTRLTRTRVLRHEIDLNNLTQGTSDLWDYFEERRDKSLKMPINLYDYLDGTESCLRLKKDGSDLSIVVRRDTYRVFEQTLIKLMELAEGKKPELFIDTIPNTRLNRYLLSESLIRAFPITTLKKLVKKEYPDLDSFELEGTVNHLRTYLSEVLVSVGLFNDNWSSIDSSVGGFVYLLADMTLDYHMNQ